MLLEMIEDRLALPAIKEFGKNKNNKTTSHLSRPVLSNFVQLVLLLSSKYVLCSHQIVEKIAV